MTIRQLTVKPKQALIRMAILAVLVAGVIGMSGLASGASSTSDHKCSPGQHGNPKPAFKPGSC
jgi:hypothetical protein